MLETLKSGGNDFSHKFCCIFQIESTHTLQMISRHVLIILKYFRIFLHVIRSGFDPHSMLVSYVLSTFVMRTQKSQKIERAVVHGPPAVALDLDSGCRKCVCPRVASTCLLHAGTGEWPLREQSSAGTWGADS